MRTLSLRELNRATLARQLLLERRRVPLLRAIERVAGLQAQWSPAPYVGLWSRVDGFRRPALERALLAGEVVKATVMRQTLHLVTARDYPVFVAALRGAPGWADPASVELGERLAPTVRALYGETPQHVDVALDYLRREHGLEENGARRVWHVARVRGHVVQAPEAALWKPLRRPVFVALPEPEEVDVDEARVELVRRYLGAFGPATRADIAEWSGLRVRDFAAALDALEPLRRFADEEGRELLDLPRAPLPAADTPVPVRFLPKWDNLLLGHSDRRRVLRDDHRKALIIRNGDVQQAFLVDGVVAGTWRAQRGRVVVEPFEPLPRRVRADVDAEAERLAAFLQ